MFKKQPYIFLILILLFSFLLRLVPALNGNFYFTMDQGRDAVYVREILSRHQLILHGPATSIEGVYEGPFWYYFLSFGYLLFQGHPFGGVFMLIILNVSLTAIIMIFLKNRFGLKPALITGLILQFSWGFYETSRFAFNPFPLVFLALILILFLIRFLEGDKNSLVWAVIPLGLALHSEVVALIPFLLLYLLVFIWGTVKRKTSLFSLVPALFLFCLFLTPTLISEFSNNFSQLNALRNYLLWPKAVTQKTNFTIFSSDIAGIIGQSIISAKPIVGFFIVLALFIYNIGRASNILVRRFTVLVAILLLTTWVWFGSSSGWRSWHTVYLEPVMFLAIILNFISFKKPLSAFLITFLFISQILNFVPCYLTNYTNRTDQSLFINEVKAIDWTYRESEGRGFSSYIYLPSVYEYPYQYLYWWYGLRQYGYLPCEYTAFPGHPSLFVPGLKHYLQPKKACSELVFLIIEPDSDLGRREAWLSQVRRDSSLTKEVVIGKILVEKRKNRY